MPPPRSTGVESGAEIGRRPSPPGVAAGCRGTCRPALSGWHAVLAGGAGSGYEWARQRSGACCRAGLWPGVQPQVVSPCGDAGAPSPSSSPSWPPFSPAPWAGGVSQVESPGVAGDPQVVSPGARKAVWSWVRVVPVATAAVTVSAATRRRMRLVTAGALSVVVGDTLTGRRPGFLVLHSCCEPLFPVREFLAVVRVRQVGRMRCTSAGGRPTANLP